LKGIEMTKRPEITGAKCAPEALVLDIPVVGAKLGISRNAAYAAVARGEWPTIQIGRLKKVPARWLDQVLDSATVKVKEPVRD
jgi:hypothetical protein